MAHTCKCPQQKLVTDEVKESVRKSISYARNAAKGLVGADIERDNMNQLTNVLSA